MFKSFSRKESDFEEDVNTTKYPLRAVERSLHTFTEVAVPTNLDRLAKQKENLAKYRLIGDWVNLRREQLNVVSTLLQLKATLKELDKTRCQVQDEDVPKFDQYVQKVKEKALATIASFDSIQDDVKKQLQRNNQQGHGGPIVENQSVFGCQDVIGDETIQLQVLNEEEEENVRESWEKLERNLMEVKELSTCYSTMLKEQGETIETIADNIDSTQNNVQLGIKSLSKAASYKASLIPITGAVLGAALGGPAVAVYTGIKVAALAAGAAGGVFGYMGGTYLKKKNQDTIDDTTKKME